MIRNACLLVVTLLATPLHAADEWSIAVDDWLRPRSGESVLQMPGLAAAIRAWQSTPDAVVVIRYPGGEEGVLWAEELRSWLVGLGVPSSAVQLAPGTHHRDRIVVAVRDSRRF